LILKLSTKILHYINITSKHIKEDAPKERKLVCYDKRSSVYGQDWESMIARQNILNKISRILGEDISKLILFEEQLTPQLIQDKTYSYKGSL
jgi:hypothetical protein